MRRIEHFLVLFWLLLTGLTVFGLVVTIDTGLLQTMLHEDKSYVSGVLIVMYVAGAGHALHRSWLLSNELARVSAAEHELGVDAGALTLSPAGVATARGVMLPAGMLTDYVRDIVRSRASAPRGHAEGGSSASADLLEAYAGRIRGEHEFGWFMIDLMLKVGFIGTLIGFIWMLASVSQHPVIDAGTMQQILRDMSSGMSIALNTTLVSLITATLLSAPYYLLNRGLDELLECVVRLTQVEILPRLDAGA